MTIGSKGCKRSLWRQSPPPQKNSFPPATITPPPMTAADFSLIYDCTKGSRQTDNPKLAASLKNSSHWQLDQIDYQHDRMATYSAKGAQLVNPGELIHRKPWWFRCTFWAFAAPEDKRKRVTRSPDFQFLKLQIRRLNYSGKIHALECVGACISVFMTHPNQCQSDRQSPVAFTFNDYPDFRRSGSGTWVMTGKDWKDSLKYCFHLFFCGESVA